MTTPPPLRLSTLVIALVTGLTSITARSWSARARHRPRPCAPPASPGRRRLRVPDPAAPPRVRPHRPVPPLLARPTREPARPARPRPIHRRRLCRLLRWGGSAGRWRRRIRWCGRSRHRPRRTARAIAASTSAARPVSRCWRRVPAWWCSPVSSPAGAWCRSTIRTACAPPTSRWRPRSRPAGGWRRVRCSGRLRPGHADCPGACLHWGVRRGAEYLDPLALVATGHVRLLPWEEVG